MTIMKRKVNLFQVNVLEINSCLRKYKIGIFKTYEPRTKLSRLVCIKSTILT